ncbi:MAG: SDR family NAD(P)-dependent oxidoreductase [Lachnospirales bacterium]
MDKVAFISGSTKGIGREIANFFAKKGYVVIVNGKKDKKALENTLLELKKINSKNIGFLCDLRDFTCCENMFKEIYKKFSKIDVLINNLGETSFELFTETSMGKMENLINNNIYGYLNPSQIVAKNMINHKEGHIINISSVFGEFGGSCEVAYSLSKGAINTFTKALAKELAPSNVFVNGVSLGFCDTSMNSYLSSEDKNTLIDEIPLGKACPPYEIAKLCFFLAEENKYITGQLIRQDGGWY